MAAILYTVYMFREQETDVGQRGTEGQVCREEQDQVQMAVKSEGICWTDGE